MQRYLASGLLAAAFALSACAEPSAVPAEGWALPPRASAKTGLLFGRVGNPGGKPLDFTKVVFQRWGKAYFHSGTVPTGENYFVLDNNYFVVPDVEPGQYWFRGFSADGFGNSLPYDKKDFIGLKAGEVKFVGSFDYRDESNFIRRKVVLTPVKKPSEAQILRYLLRAGKGSGWEDAIKKRLQELS
jgi:hypothetical protein